MVYPVQKTGQRTVLIVDSRPDDYSKLTQNLQREGMQVEIFKSGRMALRRAASPAPEMWIVNMKLADISGPDLLAMLRWLYPGVPVYLVSDEYEEQDEITARCAGAEMYFCKPLESSWLVTAAQHAS